MAEIESAKNTGHYLCGLGVGACAQGNPQTAAKPPPLLPGAAWYPEQWPESRWNADLGLMQKAPRLERWRESGSKEGLAARDRLRDDVESALLALGTGFLTHLSRPE
jgi:hypothetical protein